MKNILVATFGNQWILMAEVLGFTNPRQFHVYDNAPDRETRLSEASRTGLRPIDELWLVTTDNELEDQDGGATQAVRDIGTWLRCSGSAITLKIARLAGVSDPENAQQCRQMRDLVFRTVLAAHEAAAGGQVVLSLVGGRKTMSGDIQEAGSIFGCSAMLQVLSKLPVKQWPSYLPSEFRSLSEKEVVGIIPVAVSEQRPRAAFLYGKMDEITTSSYPVSLGNSECAKSGLNAPSTALVERIESLSRRAGVVLSNFTTSISMEERGDTFASLMGLHPSAIERLRSERLGLSPSKEASDLTWIHSLPKTELHCHFGGILTPLEMIRVAVAERDRVREFAAKNSAFGEWIGRLARLRDAGDLSMLRTIVADKERFRNPVPGIPRPLANCAFIGLFEDDPEQLDELVFDRFRTEESFFGIGIDTYEQLGDLQGSGLMQSEACLREATRCLLERCRASNIRYCEVRCSPINYVFGGLEESDVARILAEELFDRDDLRFSFLFIASRHGRSENIGKTVALAKRLLTEENIPRWSEESISDFRRRFVGFDLAGAEGSARPSAFRAEFEPLFRDCVQITIHAGETEPADSIWDAVYGLNADRIGHGLTLVDRKDLLEKFLDRNIAVEMCPSSNFQICGYRDNWLPGTKEYPEYPLERYLDSGLRVSVNTDDPGLSRTTLDREYLKAARMTSGGLSKWNAIKLTYNGFASSFAPYDTRRKLIRMAGNEILSMIESEYEAP